jgi:hypothetical protein
VKKAIAGASTADTGDRLRVVGQTIGLRGLLGWAFRPRNFMKKWHHGIGGSGEVGLTVKK